MKVRASFDDGPVEDVRAAELMSKYNIETIFYWPVYEDSARKGLSGLQKQRIASNFEIGSHTLTHPLLTRVDTDRAWIEINNSREILKDEFRQEINSFCYPRGYANPEIEQMVAEAGYSSARGVTVGYIYESENPYYQQTTVHIGYDRKEYGGKGWLEYARFMLEEAKNTPNSIYSMFGHSWEIEGNNAWDDFETLLKELK